MGNAAREIEFEELELQFAYHGASGDDVCEACNRSFRRHPMDYAKLDRTGQPFLRVLCSGMRVRI